ncbi:MAG: efflux RND transporter periplasmic adaptor subunit [Candidatus Polarisedimenticolaceae bacterium]|nr:efflux RND transporter periplasmic adaptor subunit [Candidatus Polarisedimenticolaceae bacterium]
MNNKTNTPLAVIAALAIGLAGGYLLFGGSQMPLDSATGEASGQTSGNQPTDVRKPLFYRNAMNPTVTSPIPAKDAMGMDYIPVYADNKAGDAPPGTVKIDPVTVQNIGVRTARAERGPLSRIVRAVGRVDFDETRLARLHPKIDGWVEKLWVDKTGAKVKHDAVLLSLYSPQLVASQEEYLLAMKNVKILGDSPYEDIRRGAEGLVKSARLRLELLDMPEHQIKELEQTGEIKRNIHIHAPFHGVVIKIGIREGQYVTPKTELYQVADLSTVWVYAEVFEYELPWIKEGDAAQITVEGRPGREFHGHIDYIYPYLDMKTRTAKVRLLFDNADGALLPQMFAEVTLQSKRSEATVLVPAEAVMRSGIRKQVFVVSSPGKFEPHEVVVGITSEGKTQILKGISEGDEVVTSAQFLIDSESSLREATAKMISRAEPETAPAEKKADGEMKMPGAAMPSPEKNHD